MEPDLYFQLGTELRSLFQILKPGDPARAHRQMEKVLAAAAEIGEPILKEAKELSADLTHYLKDPEDPHFSSIMRKHALRLEQETREL